MGFLISAKNLKTEKIMESTVENKYKGLFIIGYGLGGGFGGARDFEVIQVDSQEITEFKNVFDKYFK